MAASDTYQTKVYQEQGAKRYVANSGGTFAIESGGAVAIYSAGQMTIESTAVNLAIAGGDLTGDDLRRTVISEQLMDSQNFVALATKLAVSNLPKNLGTYIIWASDAAADGSFWMTSVSAGREVFLLLAGDSTGTFTNKLTTIKVSCSGCKILGSLGGYMSHILLNASVASDCMVHFLAPYDDYWAIINTRGDVDEVTNV